MAYATSTDITDKYGANYLVDVADRDDNDTADTTAVTEALDDAASQIDAVIGKRFAVPLATVPPWLVRCNVDVAVYELASEGRLSLTTEMAHKHVKWLGGLDERGRPVKGFLEKVADGEVSLGLGDNEPDTLAEPVIYDDDRVLGVGSTEGLI